VKKSALTQVINTLGTKLQRTGKKAPVTKLRMANIQWIQNLQRKGLAYQKKERQLLIHTTNSGERIFIQYPGKESRTHKKNGKERKKTAIRPWDFRPILYISGNVEPHEDMSFGTMWAAIFETPNKLTRKNKKETLRVLATLLYRMAFMIDHEEIKTFNTQYRDVTYKRDNVGKVSIKRKKKLPPVFKYKPNQQVLDYISKNCPRWGDMSLEAFLFYNELLVWNEDCKYYYRNYRVRDDAKWIASTGRINILLSHIRILGYILGDISLSDIFDGFAKQRGISPASNDEVACICRDFVERTRPKNYLKMKAVGS